MAMWICWTDPDTRQERRLYNYYDPDAREGIHALKVARRALSRKLGVAMHQVPGFHVLEAPWLSETARRVFGEVGAPVEGTPVEERQMSVERELVASPA